MTELPKENDGKKEVIEEIRKAMHIWSVKIKKNKTSLYVTIPPILRDLYGVDEEYIISLALLAIEKKPEPKIIMSKNKK